MALEVANEVGVPLMAHIDHPPPTYEDVIARLRPGDILTHAFRPFPNAPIGPQGTVKREVLDARARGVRFDIGHGKGSFAFKTARAMLANGFLPDTISSDVHALCINGPAFDQVTTMSRFLCLGMPLADVVAASTVNAAMALKRPELGSLKPGGVGDATILSIKAGSFDYVDAVGEHLTGDRKIASEGVVLAGRWWHPRPPAVGSRRRPGYGAFCRFGETKGRAPQLSWAGGLGQPDQVEKLGTVAEGVLAPGRGGERDHLVVAKALEIGLASEELPECRDRNREAHLGRGLIDGHLFERLRDRELDAAAHSLGRQLIVDPQEAVLALAFFGARRAPPAACSAGPRRTSGCRPASPHRSRSPCGRSRCPRRRPCRC